MVRRVTEEDMGPQCCPAKMEKDQLVPQRMSGFLLLLGKLTLAMPLGLASLFLLARGLPMAGATSEASCFLW